MGCLSVCDVASLGSLYSGFVSKKYLLRIVHFGFGDHALVPDDSVLVVEPVLERLHLHDKAVAPNFWGGGGLRISKAVLQLCPNPSNTKDAQVICQCSCKERQCGIVIFEKTIRLLKTSPNIGRLRWICWPLISHLICKKYGLYFVGMSRRILNTLEETEKANSDTYKWIITSGCAGSRMCCIGGRTTKDDTALYTGYSLLSGARWRKK